MLNKNKNFRRIPIRSILSLTNLALISGILISCGKAEQKPTTPIQQNQPVIQSTQQSTQSSEKDKDDDKEDKEYDKKEDDKD